MSASISVVVPVFNAAADGLLEEALKSLRAQTFTDWECICVDDGSTDASPRMLSGFAHEDPRFRIVTKPNGGPSSARNVGIDAAKGEFLFFLDADDMLYRDALSTLHSLASRTCAEVVWGQHTCTGVPGGKGELVAEGRTLWRMLKRKFGYGPAAERGISLHNIPVMAWNKLFRRDFLSAHSARFDNDLAMGEDLVFLARVMRHVSRLAVTAAVTYLHRSVAGSLFHDHTLRNRERNVDAVCRFAEEERRSKVDLSGYLACGWVFSWLRAAWSWARDDERSYELFAADCHRIGAAFAERLPMSSRTALAVAPLIFRIARKSACSNGKGV